MDAAIAYEVETDGDEEMSVADDEGDWVADGDDLPGGDGSDSDEPPPSLSPDAMSEDEEGRLDIKAELAYIARKYLLPNEAITDIIQLFKNRLWSPEDLELWDTFRDLEAFEEELMDADDTWETMDLELAGDHGVVVDHMGVPATVFTMLHTYGCDHPESSMVTGTMAASSYKPCSMCIVDRWDLKKVTKAFEARTVKDQRNLYQEMEEGTPTEVEDLKRAWSTHYVACALWEWGYVTTDWGNFYESIGVCLLHVVDEGWWLHWMRCWIAVLTAAERKEVLRRCRVVLADTPASVLRTPNVSTYFRTTHTALAIPSHDRMDRGSVGQVVKASPKENKFSHIRIAGGRADWFARCLVLFHYTDESQQIQRRAFVRYFTEQPFSCSHTGCRMLLPMVGKDAFAILDVDSILCLSHIVPCFSQPGYYLVNRFLF
ncbi:unnamed protein product [Closterium sp. NIES-65]|nr:unnamed protein product [Closterium sp. NIES-65]